MADQTLLAGGISYNDYKDYPASTGGLANKVTDGINELLKLLYLWRL